MSEQQVQAYQAQHSGYASSQLKHHSDALQSIQSEAMERLVEAGFPTLRDEEWRYTDTKALFKQSHSVSLTESHSDASVDMASIQLIKDSITLVFINGVYSAQNSTVNLPKGLHIESMAEAVKADSDALAPYLNTLSSQYEQGWTILNTAFIQQGVFIRVDDNAQIEPFIEIININNGVAENTVEQLRHVFVVGDNAKVSIFERYLATDETKVLSNVVTEMFCGDKGHLTRIILQEHADTSTQIHQTYLRQGHESNIHNFTLSLTGRLIRNELYGQILGEHSLCKMYGLYAPNGRQHIDNCTQVEHMVPNCVSDELYKGVLDDHGRAIFRGRIYVAEDAQKTDAYQTNRNMLLSRTAEVDVKPQLEIYADDVKCSHGATIGQLNKEQLFYLRSRGVEEKEARKLLIYAFVGEVLDSIEEPSIKAYLEEALRKQLYKGAMFINN